MEMPASILNIHGEMVGRFCNYSFLNIDQLIYFGLIFVNLIKKSKNVVLFKIGVAVLRYFNEIYKETTTKPICQPSDVHNSSVEDVSDDIFKIGMKC